MFQPGSQAPAFSVPDHEGITRSLADYAGRTLVLWFYPAADTPGCTREGCAFRDLMAEYDAADASILGVSFDTRQANAAFAEKYGFDYPLLCDTERQVGLAYGAADLATQTAPRRQGTIIGPDGTILAHWPKVDASGFPAQALNFIRARG